MPRRTRELPLYRRDRRNGRAKRSGQPQRWRGEQETESLVHLQPAVERGEVPELAKMDAKPEQAGLVQRHRRAMCTARQRSLNLLDRIIVGDQNGDPAVV